MLVPFETRFNMLKGKYKIIERDCKDRSGKNKEFRIILL